MNNYPKSKTALQPLRDTQNFIDDDVAPVPLNLSPDEAYRARIVNKTYVEYRNLVDKKKHTIK